MKSKCTNKERLQVRQALSSFLFQGNLLLLGGFGNLRGNVEIWSEAGKERKEVAKFDAPDSTDVRWSPSGKFLMTSTCAPRLRVGNGFRIWHYSRHVHPFASHPQVSFYMNC